MVSAEEKTNPRDGTDQDVVQQDQQLPDLASLPPASQHHALKHHLLGPSLTKAGQDGVDQKKVAEVIYEASKGSKYFNNEEAKDKVLAAKIERILKLKARLEKLDLKIDAKKADEYIASLELSRDLSQYLVHIDCDAFYAAVEEIDRPELKNVPMAVGEGVLTTCNYLARKFGCRSAMAGFVAKKLCPELVCIPLNFEKYTAKAKEVRAILAEYDPRFQSSSIDEAYLNITEYCRTYDMEPDAVMEQLRREVHEKCKITISAGIAPNAKIAKICSNKNKPNGQFRIPNDRAAIMSFMSTLPVRKVNGVGRVFERELQAVGIETCGDIYSQRAYLSKMFGEKAFQFLMQTYLGLGRTDVSPAEEHERKSVGTESTFRETGDKQELRDKLRHTAEELEKDMKRVQVKGRTLVLKAKLHTYEVISRQTSPPKTIHLADDLYNYALPMMAKLEKEVPGFKLRLMGLRCTHLLSTKKTEVDFFRPRANPRSESTEKNTNNGDDGEWEVWPDSEFEEAARQEQEEEIEALEQLSQENKEDSSSTAMPLMTNIEAARIYYDPTTSTADWHEPFGTYKYGSETNTPMKSISPDPRGKESLSSPSWNCPICDIAQPANDKDFNTHIDACLSRQTIRDAIAAADQSTSISNNTSRNQSIDADITTSNIITSQNIRNTNHTLASSAVLNGSSGNITAGIKRKSSSSLNTSTATNSTSSTGNHHKQKKLFFA